MKKLFIVLMAVLTLISTAHADITAENYTNKERIIKDLENWAIVEQYLKSAVLESQRDIANALKVYQLIPADSPIYSIQDAESNLIVPRSDMTTLYQSIKSAMEQIQADHSVFLTGEGAQ